MAGWLRNLRPWRKPSPEPSGLGTARGAPDPGRLGMEPRRKGPASPGRDGEFYTCGAPGPPGRTGIEYWVSPAEGLRIGSQHRPGDGHQARPGSIVPGGMLGSGTMVYPAEAPWDDTRHRRASWFQVGALQAVGFEARMLHARVKSGSGGSRP